MKKLLYGAILTGVITLGMGAVASAQDFSGGTCTNPNIQWPGKAKYCAVYGPGGTYDKIYGKGGLYCTLYGYNC